MIIASIHRNEHNNEWIVLIRDTIRETKSEHKAETLVEAEAIAQREGSQNAVRRVRISLGR